MDLLKFLGIENPSQEKEIFISPAEEKKASDFLRANNLDGNYALIGISLSASVQIEGWDEDKFSVLADKLAVEKNAKIIFVGSSADQAKVAGVQKMMQNNSVNACGAFSLRELPALLRKLKLFISKDTGPLHIADALGVPVVDITGPIDTDELYPLSHKSRLIKKDIYCAPCSFMFQPPPFCKEKHSKCLKDITVEEVFKAAAELL